MDKGEVAQRMVALAARLTSAAAEGDWRGLRALDSEVETLLSRLHARDLRTREQRSAFDKLRRAHEQARKRCADELQRAGRQLARARDRRSAWIAYAMNDDDTWDELPGGDSLQVRGPA